MLVLSRMAGQIIVIGSGKDAVEVMVVGVDGSKVRLGITAPKDVPVHRKEVYDKINTERDSTAE